MSEFQDPLKKNSKDDCVPQPNNDPYSLEAHQLADAFCLPAHVHCDEDVELRSAVGDAFLDRLEREDDLSLLSKLSAALRECGSPDITKRLVGIARNEAFGCSARIAAIQALTGTGDVAAQHALVDLLLSSIGSQGTRSPLLTQNNEKIAECVSLALVGPKDPEVESRLFSALKPSIFERISDAIGVKIPWGAARELAKNTRKRNLLVALTDSQNEDVLALMRHYMKSSNDRVCIAAVNAVCGVPHYKNQSAILEKLETEQDRNKISIYGAALTNCPFEDIRAKLVGFLTKEDRRNVGALLALTGTDRPNEISAIYDLMISYPSDRVMKFSIGAVEGVKDEKIVRFLISQFDSQPIEIQDRILGVLTNVAAMPDVQNLAKSAVSTSSQVLRGAALKILKCRSESFLYTLLSDADGTLAMHAAASLRGTQDPQVLEYLIQDLSTKNDRFELVTVALMDSESVKVAQGLLNVICNGLDFTERERISALKALGSFRGEPRAKAYYQGEIAQLLESTELDMGFKVSIFDALAGTSSAALRSRLMGFLDPKNPGPIVMAAARALSSCDSQLAQEVLADSIDKFWHDHERAVAIQSLVGCTSPRAIRTLISSFEGPQFLRIVEDLVVTLGSVLKRPARGMAQKSSGEIK